MQSVEKILQKFRENGLKITPQRRLIIELLTENKNHPNADEIYKLVIEKSPETSQATIYNTIRELISLGLVNPVDNFSVKGIRFDTNNTDHHHLYCIHCFQLIDIERDFPNVKLTNEEVHEYQILKNQITFYGVCKQCQTYS